jgi:hypothetical protein
MEQSPQFCSIGTVVTDRATKETRDGRCQCCGRERSELAPFGGPGDPLLGDFSGALLVRKYRTVAPEPAPEERGQCGEEPRETHSPEKAVAVMSFYDPGHQVRASWECRDCFALPDREYHQVPQERSEAKRVIASSEP